MGWHHVADTADLAQTNVIGRRCEGHDLAIYRIDDRYYATSNRCTHAAALLSEGEVVEGWIECPLHYALFEIATGKAQGGYATRDLASFPVRLEGSRILVDIGS